MRPQRLSLLQTACLIASILLRTCQAQASSQQRYCSTQNTAGDNQVDVNDYQSMGRCRDRCVGSGYAFAVLQWKSCWCSNYIPSDTVSTSQCSASCPGFPSDLCGNESAGLFGYIALNVAPSGTFQAQSPAATSQTSTSASSTSTIQSSSVPQLQSSPVSQLTIQTLDPTTVVSFVTLSPSSTSTTSTSTTSTSASTTNSATAAVTSVQVVTVSGAVVYETVTSTPVAASPQDNDLERVQQSGLSGGAIAGIVIGVLGGLAAVVLGLFLLWRRRRRSGKDETVAGEKGGRSPKRNISVLSRAGLLARGRHDSNNERDFDEPINPGSTSQRHSMLFGAPANAEGVSPASVLETTHSGDSRRHSKPMVYDQRLNPSALFGAHDNGSRTSMQDNADYSRTLGVTNPDPRASFESRISRA